MAEEMWVLDASIAGQMEDEVGVYPFCPLEGDPEGEFSVVVGLTLVTDKPPGKFVGIVHRDGQEAAEAWAEAHKDYLDRTFTDEGKTDG